MKKILFATTALVASTSFAMADVDISGEAEMGVFGGEDVSGEEIDTQFHTDINVIFEMTGETDGGLTFGAAVELSSTQDDSTFDPAGSGDDVVIFVSGALGTLTMGDTDGALDFALSEAIIGSALADDHEHFGYNGNSGLDGTYDGQIARYDYAFGDFAIAVSAEIDDDSDDNFDGLDPDDFTDELGNRFDEISSDTVLGIGARYAGTFNNIDFGAGIGYQRAGDSELVDVDGDGRFDDVDASSVLGVSLKMSMDNGLQAIANYSTFDNVRRTSIGTDDELVGIGVELENHWGLAVGYEFGAFLVAANYGEFSFDGAERSGIGLVGNYNLGGGAELQAGYARNEFEIEDAASATGVGRSGDFDTYSFGIALNF